MSPSFTKKSFFKHVCHKIDEKPGPFDEEHSVKTLYDEESSDISSAETLLSKREPVRSNYGFFFALNVAMFCLSATLFVVSGDRLMETRRST